MKKYIIIFSLLLLLTGCGKTDTIDKVSYDYNRSFYKVYTSNSNTDNNYAIGKIFNRYDLKEVEIGLMRISTKYFVPTKYYYQTGQYLSGKELNDLLSGNKLNKADTRLGYKPRYISYIHEQDYLNLKGELKGISLGLVLNPYQTYVTSTGQIKYDVLNIDELINVGKQKSQELLNYMRSKSRLSNVEIVIGLYIEENTSSMLPGSYTYETFARGNSITSFNKIDEKYILLTDNTLSNIDLKSYENFAKLKQKIGSSMNDTSIMGRGLYVNNQLTELTIDININYMTIGEVNNIAQITAQEIPTLFNKNVLIQAIIKNENNIEAIVTKDSNKSKSKIIFVN